MACSCTDRLNDLSDKFDLILELIDEVVILLAGRVPAVSGVGGGGGGQFDFRLDQEWDKTLKIKKLLETEGNELMELIEIICISGVLDG